MSKRKFLTLDERVKVLKLSDAGKSSRAIADELGVGRTQILGIVKRKREILSEFESNAHSEAKRPRRASTFEDINELCLNWFNDATGRQINVSGPLLKEKALKFAADLGLTDSFKASNGWLESFLKRNNIVFKKMSGERGAVNQDTVDDWKSKLPTICEGFEPANIFNMDETGLFFRDTTRSTYFKKGEDCAGGKRSKDRLTVALCASMMGEKIKPLVIGNAKKPRCFSRISTDRLPVMYRANKKAWMNGMLYEEWLRWFDRRMTGRKVLLFVDNAPSHPPVKLNNVTVKYLPANTTSLCQPMDQGLIQAVKLKYRKRQLKHVLTEMEQKTTKSGDELLKEISVIDALYWVSQSWKEVEVSTVVKCFQKAGFKNFNTEEVCFDPEEAYEPDDDFPIAVHMLARQLFDCDLMELISIDKDFATYSTDSTSWDKPATELLRDIRDDYASEEDNEDEPVPTEETSPCSVNECVQMINKLKDFAKFHGNADILSSAMDLGDLVVNFKLSSTTKQMKISDYFSSK